jgi:hypothetical protein
VLASEGVALAPEAAGAGGADGAVAEPGGESGVEIAVKFWHDPGVAEQHRATDAAAQAAIAAIAALAEFGMGHEVPQRRVVNGRAVSANSCFDGPTV